MMTMTDRDLTYAEQKMLKKDVKALFTILTLIAIGLIGATYFTAPFHNNTLEYYGLFLDDDTIDDISMAGDGDDADGGLPGTEDRPDQDPEPEPEPEPDRGLLDGYDNPIDPDLTMKEVCYLYLNNRTNSCGSFSGGGGGYPATQEPVPIPEFPVSMIPAFAGLLGLYMRKRPTFR